MVKRLLTTRKSGRKAKNGVSAGTGKAAGNQVATEPGKTKQQQKHTLKRVLSFT
jgi:hypothetical protein